MDIEVLIKRYPRLYHMAECGSWSNIEAHGLQSTSAILDLHGINGADREIYESTHRPEKFALTSSSFGRTVLRDQKPMSDARLRRCLPADVTPRAWYEILNRKVFFWVSHERLLKLLGARAYRNEEHDVLTLNSEPLIRRYAASIKLCHMNSGNTFPVPHMRRPEVFANIADYPVRPRNGAPLKEVVELVVDYAVPDIRNFVMKVDRMKARTVVARLYSR
ncbi:MAG: hypothetical protein KIT42_14955 [Rhodocyclaceae bacterium]|nr:hypothetical protein [Rhodocyclaceae bacterium]MCW5597174.1 hypothetical protein [Rhodocyclaceae bacterium]